MDTACAFQQPGLLLEPVKQLQRLPRRLDEPSDTPVEVSGISFNGKKKPVEEPVELLPIPVEVIGI